MYCANCGREIADESKYCKYCGTSTGVAREVAEEAKTDTRNDRQPNGKSEAAKQVGKMASPISEEEAKLTGVGGWLLFYIISLTFLAPIRIVMDIIKISSQEGAVLGIVLDVLLGIYCVITGINLWLVGRHAHLQAKIYSWISIGIGIFSIIMTASDPNEIGQSIGSLINGIIWTLYVYRSRRMENTYAAVG